MQAVPECARSRVHSELGATEACDELLLPTIGNRGETSGIARQRSSEEAW